MRGSVWGICRLYSEALLLPTQCFEGAFTSGVGGGDEFCEVGAGEWAVGVEGVLEDGYDCLLQCNDLGLESIFCECCRRCVF